ncbi:hypothetical protein N7456_005031 [Penicillium angulare]|uniref:Uncharacterized protein n=1 Tax=Penicillium angulare TaxID=116970 RepID=A0A9W9FXJ3_9EURO|nr:hypothetical protein N7456_005031 [Penicillium angulare]
MNGKEKSTIFALDLGAKQLEAPLTSGRVISFGFSPVQKKTLVKDQPLPDGIQFSSTQQRLYWTNMGSFGNNDGQVMASNIDGSEVTTILPKGEVYTPKQLAIDESRGKLYVADREGLRILCCNLDGSSVEALIATGDWRNPEHLNDTSRWCVGVALSPRTGTIFWSQKGGARGNQGRLFCSHIGMPRKEPDVILINLAEPLDLYFDDERNILYWTDRGELPFGNSLNELEFDTLDPPSWDPSKHKILAGNFHDPIGLVVNTVDRYAYVTDMGGSIYKCNLVDGGKERIYHDERCAFSGITRCNL